MTKKIATTVLLLMIPIALVFATYGLGPASAGSEKEHSQTSTQGKEARLETAIFAGGCFWCVESNFEHVDGVLAVVSGYTGGHKENPTYSEVCNHTTGHLEAVKITYDSNQVTYNDLLEVLWRTIDPTDAGGQFVDRGDTYASAIFAVDDSQRELAKMSIARLQASGRFSKEIVTPILDAQTFYDAEDYHQDYYKKNPVAYHSYRWGSGRDQFIAKVWGKEKEYKIVGPSDADKKMHAAGSAETWTDEANEKYIKPSDDEVTQRLNQLQYRVTQKDSTESPFSNEFWDNKQAGIYVDVLSGEPLFSSKDKFKSGTGWPSFTRPLVQDNVTEHVDRGILSVRTEVRSKHADSHLGHVFNDGPAPTGLRYCINSAALRFVPKEKLKEQGYEHFVATF